MAQKERTVRSFSSLSEQEVLALAIALEEEDGRIYADFADGLKTNYPDMARMLEAMRAEEDGHRHRLLELYRQKFGEHIPLIRRQDVKGFVTRRPIWLVRPLGLDAVRKQIEEMEMETRRFYETAIKRSTDAGVRQLLGDLAEEERKHSALAEEIEREQRSRGVQEEEAATRKRLFVLQVIQPGLAGLMDGSVSTLAPLFAAAFATARTARLSNPDNLALAYEIAARNTFLIGLAASVGAGISMAFAEGLSDDGSLTGRGRPLIRGLICGLMTTLGGLGHTLPYLIPNVWTATTVAIAVVCVELGVIAWIRHRYMDTSWAASAFQVVFGGVLVFLAGIFIGSE
jgi:rubrerythrin